MKHTSASFLDCNCELPFHEPPADICGMLKWAELDVCMMTAARTAVFLLACSFTVCVTGLVTNPPVENGGTVTVAAPENAPYVTILCAVTDANNMTIGTNWIHVDPKANPMRQLVSNIPLFERGPFPFRNLTIEIFSQSLDETTLECSNLAIPGLQEVFFLLRIISKLRYGVLKSTCSLFVVVFL